MYYKCNIGFKEMFVSQRQKTDGSRLSKMKFIKGIFFFMNMINIYIITEHYDMNIYIIRFFSDSFCN